MSLHPSTTFRAAGFAALAVAGLAMGTAAHAQTGARPIPVNAPASTVPYAQCAAFGGYLVDELKAFPGQLSDTFRNSASRFIRAKCATHDADGEIQIVLMNDQDGASWRTARKRMGTFDIMGVSGVRGCTRPPNGVCPAATSSNGPAGVGG
jgi:hypothetical protein